MSLCQALGRLHSDVDRLIDRRFFREKYEYRATIQKASEALVSIIELEPLLDKLIDTVVEALKIEQGSILLRQEEPEGFVVAIARNRERPDTASVLEADHPIVRHLEARRKIAGDAAADGCPHQELLR